MPRGRPRKVKPGVILTDGVTPEASAAFFENEILSEDKLVDSEMIKCAHDSFHQPDLYSKKDMIEKDGQFYCSENCANYH